MGAPTARAENIGKLVRFGYDPRTAVALAERLAAPEPTPIYDQLVRETEQRRRRPRDARGRFTKP